MCSLVLLVSHVGPCSYELVMSQISYNKSFKNTPRFSLHGKPLPIPQVAWFLRRPLPSRKTCTNLPTIMFEDGSACRINGSLSVKRVSASVTCTSLHLDHGLFLPQSISQRSPNLLAIRLKSLTMNLSQINRSSQQSMLPHALSLTNKLELRHTLRTEDQRPSGIGIFFNLTRSPSVRPSSCASPHLLFICCIGVIGGIFVRALWDLEWGSGIPVYIHERNSGRPALDGWGR